MEALMKLLEAVLVLAAGLAARFALLVLVLLLLAIPIGLAVYGLEAVQTLRRRLRLVRVDGLFWKPDVYYATGHTWIRPQGTRVRIGLDDLAQRLLLGARKVMLPALGAAVRQGEAVTAIACGNKWAKIASPVDGTVTAVNTAVARDPTLLHRDPYAKGWLFTVAPRSRRYDRLLHGEPARRWFGEEAFRLTQFLERELGVAPADGGEFIVPAPWLLQDEQWKALTREFLKT